MNPNAHFGELPHKLRIRLAKELNGEIDKKKGAAFTRCLKAINRRLDKILIDGGEYSKYIDPDSTAFALAKERGERKTEVDYTHKCFFGRETLRRLFLNKKKGTINKFAYALAAFAGYSIKEFHFICSGEISNEEKVMDGLIGAWNVYVYDSSNKKNKKKKTRIKQTCLWLDRKMGEDEVLEAEFVAPWGKKYTGTARIDLNNTLSIEFRKKDFPVLLLSAKLPPIPEKDDGDVWILNAGGMSTEGKQPVIGSLIFVKKNYFKKDSFLDKGVNNVEYKDNLPIIRKDPNTIDDYLVNSIVLYLTKNTDRGITPFIPNDVSTILSRNEYELRKVTRDSYRNIKDILDQRKDGYKWYSFSRVLRRDDRIGIFEWNFKAYGSEQRISVQRHRINNPERRLYEGEVTMESQLLCMKMNDDQGNPKFFFSDIATNEEPILFYGLSCTTPLNRTNIEPKHIATREILIYMDEKIIQSIDTNKLIDGYMDYNDFIEIDEDFLNSSDKLYLAQREYNVVTYPFPTDNKKLYSRQNRVLDMAGDYFIFVRNIYENEALFVLTMKIDKLTNVQCNIEYRNMCYSLKGIIQGYSQNLHISLEYMPNNVLKEKIANLMFDPIKHGSARDRKLYSGITLDTNEDGNVGAYPFIMVPADALSNLPFEPKIIVDVLHKINEKKDGESKALIKLNNIIKASDMKLGDIKSYLIDTDPLGRLQNGN